jgi:hypothetical protein
MRIRKGTFESKIPNSMNPTGDLPFPGREPFGALYVCAKKLRRRRISLPLKNMISVPTSDAKAESGIGLTGE